MAWYLIKHKEILTLPIPPLIHSQFHILAACFIKSTRMSLAMLLKAIVSNWLVRRLFSSNYYGHMHN
jgi:hypothetical protein